MADLLDRVLGLLTAAESHRAIPYNALLAAMREVQRGELTQGQVNAALELSGAEITALWGTVYEQLFGGAPTLSVAEFEDLLVLGATRNREDASGVPYYAKNLVMTRLGL
jgi:hypothetical protein